MKRPLTDKTSCYRWNSYCYQHRRRYRHHNHYHYTQNFGGEIAWEVPNWQTLNEIERMTRRHNKVTAWNRVLPGKLTGPQLLKKFPAFYGTRKFSTACTRARHLLGCTEGSVLFRGLCVCFVTCLTFYSEELLAPCSISNLEDHPLLAVRDYLFHIFAATLHIWRPFL